MQIENLPERWRRRIVVADTSFVFRGEDLGPCWNWQGWNNGGSGHGKTRVGGKAVYIYRAVRIFFGLPMSGVGDHLCENPPCCNPRHVEPVTVGENTRRGNAVLFQPVDPEEAARMQQWREDWGY